jgi:hypothetical protein
LLKESLLVLAIIIILIIFFLYKVVRDRNIKVFTESFSLYQTLLLVVIISYWIVSIESKLNLGVRHLFPVVSLTYILIASILVPLLTKWHKQEILIIFGVIYVIEALIAYPKWLSHFNPLYMRYEYKHDIFVDSNLDWGQDLKRLKEWVDQNDIQKIHIEYFGAHDIWDYFDKGDSRIVEHIVHMGEIKEVYFAVSATWYQHRYGDKFDGKTGLRYWYLGDKKPITIIGDSILIFKL